MKTVTVQIGNSDDRLTQRKWGKFFKDVEFAVASHALQTHFIGFSLPHADWQNAAWVFEIDEGDISPLRFKLGELAHKYGQNSIAWLEGRTEFIRPI